MFLQPARWVDYIKSSENHLYGISLASRASTFCAHAYSQSHIYTIPSAKTIPCPERQDSLAIFRFFWDIFRFCFDQLVQALRKCPMFEEMKEHFCAVGGFSFLLHGAVRFCAGYFKSKEMVCLAIFSYFLEVAQIGTLPRLNVKF